jgi:ATP-binding cassette subfamily C protein CydCD
VKWFDRRLLARPEARRGVLIATASGAAQSIAVVAGAAALATALTGVFQRHQSTGALAIPIAIFAAAVALRAVLIYLGEASGHAAAAAAIAGLRQQAIRDLAARGPVGLSGTSSGEVAAQLTSGLEGLDFYYARFLPQIVVAVAVPVVAIAYVLTVDWVSAVILTVTLPMIPFFAALIGHAAEQSTRKRWQTFQALGGYFLDVLQGLPTLRLFGRSSAQVAQLRAVSDRLRSTTMATLRVAFVSSFALELLASLGVALLAVTIAVRLVDGTLDLRSGLTVLILAPEVYLPARNLGAAFHGSMDGVEAAGALFATTRSTPSLRTPIAMPVFDISIRLEHVTFAHVGRTAGLVDMDVAIGAGERVVLRGPSGAGKSSVLSLILGLTQAQSGRVRIGGVDIAATRTSDWSDVIAWLPQHPHLFAGSIADNVLLGRPDATEADIRDALATAGAGFVRELPGGLETVVGEQGVTLSGGQRQRIALARTLLRRCPIVLLDEPLAHLDPQSRTAVSAAIERSTRGRTVIIAAHALDDFAWAGRSIDVGETSPALEGAAT